MMRRTLWLGLFSVFLIFVLPACSDSGGGGNGGVTPEDEAESETITNNAVDDFVSGEETDFDTLSQQFENALESDPNNEAAILFKAVVDYLSFFDDSASGESSEAAAASSTGLREIYEALGYTNSNPDGGLFGTQLERDEGAGDDLLADGAPTGTAIRGFIVTELGPELETLLDELERVSTTFEYTITLDAEDSLFDEQSSGDTTSIIIDYADIALLRSWIHLVLAVVDIVESHNFNLDDLNEFDDSENPVNELICAIDEELTTFGTLENQERLESSRDHFQAAEDAYQEASTRIRSETTAQMENGLITLGRNVFDSVEERNEFLASEASFRAWAEEITDALDTNGYVADQGPDGDEISDPVTINFNTFFSSFDLREVFFEVQQDEESEEKTVRTDFEVLAEEAGLISSQ
ncbi:MAG: hypothetical protein AAF517_15955 [Planctomycetota bacterium]